MNKNLKITIEVDKKTGAIKVVENELKGLDAQAKRTSKNLDTYTAGIAKYAAGIFGIATAIGAVKDSFSTFRELDSLIGGIGKTTGLDRTSKELAGIVDQLDRLATTNRGMAVADLYRIAEGAGQLGIAKEDIVSFTETVEKLKLTTDLTAEEASSGFARIANVLHEPVKDIERLGSVFNELSNKTTATVRDLMYFTQRIGVTGKQIGLTTPEILGLSAAMKDMSINFEVGGTAVSKTLAQIQAKSSQFADAIGMDFDRFATMLKEKPMAAFDLFLQKLNQLQGGEKFAFLKQLGLNGTETATVLLNISANLEKVHQNIQLASDEYKRGTSLELEYQQASQSVDAALDQLSSNLDVLGKNIYSNLKEPMVSAISTASEFVGSINDGNSSVGDFLVTVGTGTATFYAFMNAGRVLAFVSSINALTTSLTAAAVAQRALNIAMKANPLVLGATAAAGAVALMTKNYRDYIHANEEMVRKQKEWAAEREKAGLDPYGNKIENVSIGKQAALGNAYVSVYNSNLDETQKQKALLRIKEQILATTQKMARAQAEVTTEQNKTTGAVTATSEAQKKLDEEWNAAVAFTKSVTGEMFQEVHNNIDLEEEKVQERYDTENTLVQQIQSVKDEAHSRTMQNLQQEAQTIQTVTAQAQQASEVMATNFAGMFGESSFAPASLGNGIGRSRALAGFGYTADGIGSILDKFRSPDFMQGLKVIGGWLFGTSKVVSSGVVVKSMEDIEYYSEKLKSGLFSHKHWTDYKPLGLLEKENLKDAIDDFNFLLKRMGEENELILQAGRYKTLDEALTRSFLKQTGEDIYDFWHDYAKEIIESTKGGVAATEEEISKMAKELAVKFEADYVNALDNLKAAIEKPYEDGSIEVWQNRLKRLKEQQKLELGDINFFNLKDKLAAAKREFQEAAERLADYMKYYDDEDPTEGQKAQKRRLEEIISARRGEVEALENAIPRLEKYRDEIEQTQAKIDNILNHNKEYEKAFHDAQIEQQKKMQEALRDTVREVFNFTRSLRDVVASSQTLRDTIINAGLSDNQSIAYYSRKVNDLEEQFLSYFDANGNLIDGKFEEMKATYNKQKTYLQTVANSVDILGDRSDAMRANMLSLLDTNDALLNANAKAMEVRVIGGTLSVERFSELIGLNEDQKQQLISTANTLTVIQGSSADTVAHLSSQYQLTAEQKAEIAAMASDNHITLGEISEMKTLTAAQKERIFGISDASSLKVGQMSDLVAANQQLYKGEPIGITNTGFAQTNFVAPYQTVGISNIAGARTDVSHLMKDATFVPPEYGLMKDNTFVAPYQTVGVSNMIPAVETGLMKDHTFVPAPSTVSVGNITGARTDVSALAKESTVGTLYKGDPITANNQAFTNLLDIKQNTQPLAGTLQVGNTFFPKLSGILDLTDEQKQKIEELTGKQSLLTEKVSTDQTLTYVEKWSRLLYEKQVADDLHNTTPLGSYSFEASDNYASLGTQEKIDFSNLTGTAVDSTAAKNLYDFAKGFSLTNDDLGYFKAQLGATMTGISDTTKLNAYNALFDVLPTDAQDAGRQYAQEVRAEIDAYQSVLDYISSATYWELVNGKIMYKTRNSYPQNVLAAMDAEADEIRRRLLPFGYQDTAEEYDKNPNVVYDNGQYVGIVGGKDISTLLSNFNAAQTNRDSISSMKFFANGGVLEHGTYSEPTIGIFAEAGQREAFVPLPDGKNIPVKISGDSAAKETRALRQQVQQLIELNRKLLRTLQEWDEHGLKTVQDGAA